MEYFCIALVVLFVGLIGLTGTFSSSSEMPVSLDVELNMKKFQPFFKLKLKKGGNHSSQSQGRLKIRESKERLKELCRNKTPIKGVDKSIKEE